MYTYMSYICIYVLIYMYSIFPNKCIYMYIYAYIHTLFISTISIIYCLYVVQICITIYVCKMCMCISIASIHTSLVCSGQRATSWSWSSFSIPSQKPGFHCKHLYLMSHLAKPHLTLYRVSCSKRLLEP